MCPPRVEQRCARLLSMYCLVVCMIAQWCAHVLPIYCLEVCHVHIMPMHSPCSAQ